MKSPSLAFFQLQETQLPSYRIIIDASRDNMSASDNQNDAMYRQQGRVRNQQANDMTPHSAVSSFNLPATYDTSLITPVSMTSSPNIPYRMVTSANMSPEMVSTTAFQNPWGENNFNAGYSQNGLRSRDRNESSYPATTNSYLPPSPSYAMAPNIYPGGNYGVSSSASSRAPGSSPQSMQYSPQQLQTHSPSLSGGGMAYQSMGLPSPSDSMFRQSNPPPILIAPNPTNRRVSATLNQEHIQRRHHSTPSTSTTTRSPPRSRGSGSRASKPKSHKKGHKRKQKLTPEQFDQVVAAGDVNQGELLLLNLTHIRPKLKWKVLLAKWNAQMNMNLTEAALQMRYKRLIERLKEHVLGPEVKMEPGSQGQGDEVSRKASYASSSDSGSHSSWSGSQMSPGFPSPRNGESSRPGTSRSASYRAPSQSTQSLAQSTSALQIQQYQPLQSGNQNQRNDWNQGL